MTFYNSSYLTHYDDKKIQKMLTKDELEILNKLAKTYYRHPPTYPPYPRVARLRNSLAYIHMLVALAYRYDPDMQGARRVMGNIKVKRALFTHTNIMIIK